MDAAHHCYVDFAAVGTRGPQYGAQALLHECSHLLADHATLAQDLGVGPTTSQIWNVAADAAINDDLRDGGCEMFNDDNPHGLVLPALLGEPDYLTPHHYFASLMARLGGLSGGSRSAVGRDDAPWAGCGSGSGGTAAPCELDDTDDLGGAASAATGTERERVRVTVATAIRDAAKIRGSVPGSREARGGRPPRRGSRPGVTGRLRARLVGVCRDRPLDQPSSLPGAGHVAARL